MGNEGHLVLIFPKLLRKDELNMSKSVKTPKTIIINT